MKKRVIGILSVIMSLLITSCSGVGVESYHQEGLNARARYLSMTQATGVCELLADYGQRVYSFSMVVNVAVEEGEFRSSLTLTAPEEIAGISVTQLGLGQESKLLWEDLILETGDLSGEGLSPVTAFPLFLETLCQGYLETVSEKETKNGKVLELYSRDPDKAVGTGQEVFLWLDPDTYLLLGGEVFQDGQRVLACEMTQFVMN